MKTLYAIGIASVLLAPAGASAQDWNRWEDLIEDMRTVPHSETVDCDSTTCTTTIVVEAGGHKAITKHVKGPGIEKKLMCMDNKPCVPF